MPRLREKHLFDPYLIGNGRWCTCCFPDGPPAEFHGYRAGRRGCNECAGHGRIVPTAEEIIAATIAERRAAKARVQPCPAGRAT